MSAAADAAYAEIERLLRPDAAHDGGDTPHDPDTILAADLARVFRRLDRLVRRGQIPSAWKKHLAPRGTQLAWAAVAQLVHAYDEGERSGAHVDWSDVDLAWKLAMKAHRSLQPSVGCKPAGFSGATRT